MSKVQQYFDEDEFLSDNDNIDNIDNTDNIDNDVEEFIEVKSKKPKKNDSNISSNNINNNINIKKETKESPYITDIIKIGEDKFIEDYKNKNVIIFCFSCNDNKKITNFYCKLILKYHIFIHFILDILLYIR